MQRRCTARRAFGRGLSCYRCCWSSWLLLDWTSVIFRLILLFFIVVLIAITTFDRERLYDVIVLVCGDESPKFVGVCCMERFGMISQRGKLAGQFGAK